MSTPTTPDPSAVMTIPREDSNPSKKLSSPAQTVDTLDFSANSSDCGHSPPISALKLTSPVTIAFPFPTVDASMIAMHGSALSRPKMDGLKKTSLSPFPKLRSRTEDLSEAPVSDDVKEEEEAERTVKSVRVMAVDFDVFCQDPAVTCEKEGTDFEL